MTSRFTRAIASALCLLCLTCGIAQAHPHVWVTATSELVYAPDGTLTSVRHAWTFDDMFSTYALQGIETKTKGVYTREELAPLAQTNVESLKEFGFFTFARAGDAFARGCGHGTMGIDGNNRGHDGDGIARRLELVKNRGPGIDLPGNRHRTREQPKRRQKHVTRSAAT